MPFSPVPSPNASRGTYRTLITTYVCADKNGTTSVYVSCICFRLNVPHWQRITKRGDASRWHCRCRLCYVSSWVVPHRRCWNRIKKIWGLTFFLAYSDGYVSATHKYQWLSRAVAKERGYCGISKERRTCPPKLVWTNLTKRQNEGMCLERLCTASRSSHITDTSRMHLTLSGHMCRAVNVNFVLGIIREPRFIPLCRFPSYLVEILQIAGCRNVMSTH